MPRILLYIMPKLCINLRCPDNPDGIEKLLRVMNSRGLQTDLMKYHKPEPEFDKTEMEKEI
jgi:acetolactate synthase regulatory subunit